MSKTLETSRIFLLSRARTGWTHSVNLRSGDDGALNSSQASSMLVEPDNLQSDTLRLEGIVSLLVQLGYVSDGLIWLSCRCTSCGHLGMCDVCFGVHAVVYVVVLKRSPGPWRTAS